MKKLLLVNPLKLGDLSEIPGKGIDGIIAQLEWSSLTRLRKINDIAVAAIAYAGQAAQEMTSIWISGNTRRLSTDIEHELNSFNWKYEFAPLAHKDSENQRSNTIFVLSDEDDTKSFEALFYEISNRGFCGVAFHIENVTKGHLALAHKFSLISAIYGVRFERHQQRLNQLTCDIIVVS